MPRAVSLNLSPLVLLWRAARRWLVSQQGQVSVLARSADPVEPREVARICLEVHLPTRLTRLAIPATGAPLWLVSVVG